MLGIKHHIKDHATKHPTFLEDTPDFLRHIEDINTKGLPPNSLLVTIDVIGLFTNIPNKEGVDAHNCFNVFFLLRTLQLID